MDISATAYVTPTKPKGLAKRRSPPLSPPKPQRSNLRSLDRYFWYTDLDGIPRLVLSTDNDIPQQVNDYTFTPSLFASESYPATFPPGSMWPPKRIDDLVCAIGSRYNDCVGDTCYNGDICNDLYCGHTLGAWKNATQDWENYFELRMTEDRGIGIITKRAFHQGAILGWYSGELKTHSSVTGGDYLMELEIGDIVPKTSPEPETNHSVYIDGEHKGNWTRFINHSCNPDAVFRIMRVGDTRIMAVEALRDIPMGKELSVDYGEEYYGLATKKRCACGVPECVEKRRIQYERAVEKQKLEKKEKRRVKKCKRAAAPSILI